MKELNRREFLGLSTSKKPNQRFHLSAFAQFDFSNLDYSAAGEPQTVNISTM